MVELGNKWNNISYIHSIYITEFRDNIKHKGQHSVVKYIELNTYEEATNLICDYLCKEINNKLINIKEMYLPDIKCYIECYIEEIDGIYSVKNEFINNLKVLDDIADYVLQGIFVKRTCNYKIIKVPILVKS